MFKKLISQIQDHFNKMADGKLFVTNVDPNLLWETYLNSFENSSIWRVNNEYDCNADKHFIRRYGNIVSVVEGKLVTLWDIIPSSEYVKPMKAMSNLVKGSAIESPLVITFDFLNKSNYQRTTQNQASFQLGYDKSLVQYTEDTAMGKEIGKVYEFNFFHLFLPKKFVDFSGKSPESIVGELKTTRQLFEKGLNVPLGTLELVRDLIQQGSLLRGDIYLSKVVEFIKLKKEFNNVSVEQQTNWMWIKFQDIPFARFANELIGTTCIELAEGKDINKVCEDFNKRVDPANYGKAKSPVSPQMIALAEKTITELGYGESFERRFALLDDIDVSVIKHTNTDNNAEKPVGLFGKAGVPTNGFSRHKRAEFDKVETVHIDKFMSEILPTITSMEVFMENRMESHLVSLFTNVGKCKNLFKWDNPFSWTYNGNLSGKSMIKEAVASRGGKTDAKIRVSIHFPDTTDDYDLHCYEPNNRHIYYMNRREAHPSSGMLDLDAQGCDGNYPPDKRVENLTYSNLSKMPKGYYELKVNNYSNNGLHTKFNVEVEIDGDITLLEFDKTSKSNEASIGKLYFDGNSVTYTPENCTVKEGKTISRNIWNLETNQFHKVNLVCESPNHWGNNNIGTKEYFFMLQGCKSDQPMRAFHIDQLNSELMANRRAIDLLGNYKMVEPSDKQLSGIGFNGTVRDELIVRAKGTHQRVLKILF